MLDKNIEPEQEERGGERGKLSWAGATSTPAVIVFLMMTLPVVVTGQTNPPGTLSPAQSSGFGMGLQTPLQFAGQAAPENQASLSMGVMTLYNDNVFAANENRVADEAVGFTSHLRVFRQTEHMMFSFGYTPFFELYRQENQYDRLNHDASLALTYQLGARFRLGVHDSFSYQNGVFQWLPGQQLTSGTTSPTALNQTVYSPTMRTLTNMAGLDLTFVKSSRTSVTLSGGYTQRKFGSQTVVNQPLYSSNGFSGGLQFQYRVTEHASLGFLLLHQDSTYQGGEVFGNRQRAQIESAILSARLLVSPSVTVTLFGGPQYVRTLDQTGPGKSVPNSLAGSGGGSITKEVKKTALNLSLQRSVSDGGGLYTSVTNTTAQVGARRRLVGLWEASVQGGASQADTSLLLSNDKTEAAIGSINFSRPIRGGSTFHISYDTTHEVSKGLVPILAGFDRNQVTVGFDYQLKAIPLGR